VSTDPNVPDAQVAPTPQQVLALPMQQPNDARAATVRDYLTTLLMALWEEGEGFSGKRPLGNSCWEWDLFIPLVRAGFISGTFETYEGEETGGLDECDDATGTQLISDAIKALSWPAEQPQDDDDVPEPDVCVCGDANCMPYWRPVHEQINAMRLKSDMVAADFTKAMLEEICELRTELEQVRAQQDGGDVRAVAALLDEYRGGGTIAECKREFNALAARFADRIAALEARDTADGGADRG
jgi:hypothetical protein